MTTRKHLKQLVRDRMRRTGEAYTVARRHVVGAGPTPPDAGWEPRGGLDGDTAALAAVLANLGVVAPHTGEPLTEAMILGVGGGLGAGYILWEFGDEHRRPRVLTLGFRRLWQYPDRWARETAERLGLHAEVHETGGRRAAAAALDAQLDRGLPAIVWVDAYALGLHGEPDWLDGYGSPPVVVASRDGDGYVVDDRSPRTAIVSADRLAAARARVGSYRNRLIAIDPGRVDLDLAPAVEAGLHAQVEHLSAASDSFSLPAWRKWSRMTTDPRAPKGWPSVFADGRGVASLRASIVAGAGRGGHLRGAYADFLDEAAELVGRERLRAAAAGWREAARRWDAVVDAALPPGDELRIAIETGDPGRWDLQTRRDAEPDEPPAVGDAVRAVFNAETTALARLREAVGPAD